MSNFNNLYDHQEQICYVQCGYCTTILLVSVPCNSLAMEMTVKCEHCTTLLSVNTTMKPSFVPLHVLASLNDQQTEVQPKAEAFPQKLAMLDGGATKLQNPLLCFSPKEEEDENFNIPITKKPPGKRQRAPSAYNCFIKEEIRRLKAAYPDMTHKQAFGTAAKNWAHLPQSQCNGGEYYGHGAGQRKMAKHFSDSKEVEGNGFLETNALTSQATTPFY